MWYMYTCYLPPSAAYDIKTSGLLLIEMNIYETAAPGNFKYMKLNTYISDFMPPLNNLLPKAQAKSAFP